MTRNDGASAFDEKNCHAWIFDDTHIGVLPDQAYFD